MADSYDVADDNDDNDDDDDATHAVAAADVAVNKTISPGGPRPCFGAGGVPGSSGSQCAPPGHPGSRAGR